jgi:uncharacterized membrane protein YhaH (DUF805 family)
VFLWAIDVATNLATRGYGSIPLLVLWLGLPLPSISVSIRRLHDSNCTGWWILIGLIPLIGWIVLLVFYLQGTDQTENRYGRPPPERIIATT